MTIEQDKKLRSQIARELQTRPNFITIRSAVQETPDGYAVYASYKGFYYIFYLRDGKIVKTLRKICSV